MRTTRMKTPNLFSRKLCPFYSAALAGLLLVGCTATSEKTTSQPLPVVAAAPAVGPTPVMPAAVPAPPEVSPGTNKLSLPMSIKAGATEGFIDGDGNQWLPDQGFTDGETTERPDLTITNTANQQIYRSERYSMTHFAQPLPNGKYLVKLHFCETFDGITGPGQRVFSFNVAGQEFKDFDVWVKAGGPLRAYVETVPVEITGGKLEITFTAGVENPQINGIEIIPSAL